jgi:hypothetical protein
MAYQKFRSAFNKDIIKGASVACGAGVFTAIAEYTVKAQELIAMGYGKDAAQESAQGRIYMELCEAANTPVAGTVRIAAYNSQRFHLITFDEFRTEALSTSTDRTKQIPYPESGFDVSEDNIIMIEFMPDVAKTITKADSTVLIDITRTINR